MRRFLAAACISMVLHLLLLLFLWRITPPPLSSGSRGAMVAHLVTMEPPAGTGGGAVPSDKFESSGPSASVTPDRTNHDGKDNRSDKVDLEPTTEMEGKSPQRESLPEVSSEPEPKPKPELKPKPKPKPEPKPKLPPISAPSPAEVPSEISEPNGAKGPSSAASKSGSNFSDGAVKEKGRDKGGGGSPGGSSSSGVMEAGDVRILHRVKPIYPRMSRRRREEGTVILVLDVEKGTVVRVTVEKSSEYRRLDESAVRALRKWRFETRDDFSVRIPVRFRLED